MYAPILVVCKSSIPNILILSQSLHLSQLSIFSTRFLRKRPISQSLLGKIGASHLSTFYSHTWVQAFSLGWKWQEICSGRDSSWAMARSSNFTGLLGRGWKVKTGLQTSVLFLLSLSLLYQKWNLTSPGPYFCPGMATCTRNPGIYLYRIARYSNARN